MRIGQFATIARVSKLSTINSPKTCQKALYNSTVSPSFPGNGFAKIRNERNETEGASSGLVALLLG